MPDPIVPPIERANGDVPFIVPAENVSLAHLMAQADAHLAAGAVPAAEALYRHLIALAPRFHPAWHALGLLALTCGQLERAAQLVARAVELDAGSGLYIRNLGEMWRRLGRASDAVTAGERATALLPRDVDAHYNLGLALADCKRPVDAATAYQRALTLDATHGLSWNNLGSALEALGDRRGARAAYARALALNPRHAEAQNNLGALELDEGRLDAARDHFEAAVAARPDFADAHFNLSSLKTYRTGDPQLGVLDAMAASPATLEPYARIRLYFALGKAREDAGRYDDAFAAYAQGNQLQFALTPTDEGRAAARARRIVDVFDQAFCDVPAAPVGAKVVTPVFIVGMPRSGTSLIEQILASHPMIHGAGELKTLGQRVEAAAVGAGHEDFCEWALNAGEADFAALGASYLAALAELGGDKRIVTDKMPGNFFLIGVIRRALPHAKIIHSMRHPLDSCFSCYARLFNDAMDFTYDLDALARYYRRYQGLMDHWNSVLPAGAMLDVRYEAVVADTAAEVHRLLDFLELPWHERCLEFHRNPRPVRTASAAQVRQPIYRSSLARWQHFEQHLQGLKQALGDLA